MHNPNIAVDDNQDRQQIGGDHRVPVAERIPVSSRQLDAFNICVVGKESAIEIVVAFVNQVVADVDR